jgi:hypothetical protein
MESLTADRVSKPAVTAPECVNSYKDGEVKREDQGPQRQKTRDRNGRFTVMDRIHNIV